MYRRKLEKVPQKDHLRLSRIFRLISLALRQLTLNEVAAAPGIDLFNPNDVFVICPSGLIRLEEERKIVTFDHTSVNKFLHSRKSKAADQGVISLFFIAEKEDQLVLTSLLLDYILQSTEPLLSLSDALERRPFLQYAVENWYEHMKRSQVDLQSDEPLRRKVLDLFGDPMIPAFLNWMRLVNLEGNEHNFKLSEYCCPSPLYIAMLLELWDVVHHLINNRSYINTYEGKLGTVLQFAAFRELDDLAILLVDKGVDVNRIANGQPSALYEVAFRNEDKLVQILLEAGARVDAPESKFGTVLQMACYHGFRAVVEKLLAHQAEVNAEGGIFGTALQAASAAGHLDTVSMLLEREANPDVKSGLLGTPCLAASTGGHLEIVTLLKAYGATFDDGSDCIWRYSFGSDKLDIQLLMNQHAPKVEQSVEGLNKSQTLLSKALQILQLKDANLTNKPITSKGKDYLKRIVQLLKDFHEIGYADMNSEHYIYKAFFWASLFSCTSWVSTPSMPTT